MATRAHTSNGVFKIAFCSAKKVLGKRSNPLEERPMAYQLVGRVMAYQGDDA